MKKSLLCFKKNLLKSLFLVLIPFLGNAQSLVLTSTNAASHTYDAATFTHTITLPFFATSLTGNFKINKDGVFSPCSLGATKVVQFNGYPSGAYMGSNGTSNTTYANLSVSSLPVGTTLIKMSFGCSNNTLSQIIIKIIVVKLPDPQLNLTITPYCKMNSNGVYNNYFGYNVSGTAINRDGLQFKVVPPTTATCPSYLNTSLFSTFNINTTTNAFSPASNFYDCNSGGLYIVKLEYMYQTIEGDYIIYTFDTTTNPYGWHDQVWNKKAWTCIPLKDPVPVEMKTQKTAQDLTTDNNEIKNKKYRIYPNPTNGEVHLETIDKETVIKSVKIYDSNNILKLNRSTESRNMQAIDLSMLKQGIYFVYVETNEGTTVEKIVRN